MFKDRTYSGYLLARRLEKFDGGDVVVLAVPRGGVPVAYQVAKRFWFPLDVIVTKKIRHPENKEYAIGAVSSRDIAISEGPHIPQEYIDKEIESLRQEIKTKEELYVGDRKLLDIKDKTVILIDDGIATGKTILLTIKMLQSRQPRSIILAIPVLPFDQVKEISPHVDELVYIVAPYDFNSVGQYYENFEQVSDEDVILLLKEINDLQNSKN